MANINNIRKEKNGDTPSSDNVTEKENIQLDPNSITINDKVFKVEPLMFQDSIDCLEYIVKLVLPAIGEVIDGGSHDVILYEGGNPMFSRSLSKLSQALDGTQLSSISSALLSGLTVDGVLADKEYFRGNLGEWKKVLMFAIKVNFESAFRDGWGEELQILHTMIAPQSTD